MIKTTHRFALHIASYCICITMLFSLQRGALAEDKEVLYDYVVKSGDSCMGIAIRELGDRKAYKILHKHNALGPTPHNLKPGTILRIPRRQQIPDAKVASRVGRVQYKKATESLWSAAGLGQGLYRAWRVWSRKKSTAVITFVDDSSIAMRANTVVVIYGPSQANARVKITRAELETGGLRTLLTGSQRLVVNTESSEVAISSGSTVVSTSNKTKSTSVSNHKGRSLTVRSRRRRGKSVSVTPGKGTWVDSGQAPAPPRDLPPAPVLASLKRIAIGLADSGVTIKGSWSPVPTAEKYRVEIAIDPTVRIVVAAFEVPKSVTSFEAQGLAPREYYLSVAAIDDKGLESLPSPRERVRAVVLNTIGPNGLPRVPGSPFVLGSVLSAPEGYHCENGGSEPQSNSVPLLTSGIRNIRCVDSEGNSSLPIPIDVPAIDFVLEDSSKGAEKIPRGQWVSIDVQSSTVFASDARLSVIPTGKMDAEIVSIDGNRIRIRVRASQDADENIELQLHQSTTAGDLMLSSIRFSVTTKDDQAQAEKRSKKTLRIGALLGVYNSQFEDSSEATSVPFLGVRTSLALSNHFAFELEARLAHRLSPSTEFPRTMANNNLLLSIHTDIAKVWTLRSRLGAALWHNGATKQGDVTRLGAVLSLGAQRQIGPGALRLDTDAFAFAGVSRRLSIAISYGVSID